MCCTAKNKVKHPIDLTKVTVHTKKEITEKLKEHDNPLEKVFFFEYGKLKFSIILIKDFIKGMTHIAFYAMSRGLEAFTRTGYQSLFVSNYDNAKKSDIEKYIKDLLCESGIDLDNQREEITEQLTFSF